MIKKINCLSERSMKLCIPDLFYKRNFVWRKKIASSFEEIQKMNIISNGALLHQKMITGFNNGPSWNMREIESSASQIVIWYFIKNAQEILKLCGLWGKFPIT